MFSQVASPVLFVPKRSSACPEWLFNSLRALALFTGIFLAISAIRLLEGSKGIHHWIIYLGGLEESPLATLALLGSGAFALMAFALKPAMRSTPRILSASVLMLFATAAF